MFDDHKAIEFYVNWLGFKVDWKHSPEGSPIYMQISLRDIVLHLSEHHGDSSPGAHLRIEEFKSLKDYHQQLLDKGYKYNRPGIMVPEWNDNEILVTVYDPFGNRISFSEVIDSRL